MTETEKSNTQPSVLSYDDVRAVSPALGHYTKGPLLDGLWKRPEMSYSRSCRWSRRQMRERTPNSVFAFMIQPSTIDFGT